MLLGGMNALRSDNCFGAVLAPLGDEVITTWVGAHSGGARALITNAWCPASPYMPAILCPLRTTLASRIRIVNIIVLSLRPLARRR